GDGQGSHSLDREPASKSALRIGLVEFFGECVRGRRFIHAYQFFKTAQNDISCLRHQVATEGAARIRQSVFMARARRVQKEARSLNGVSAYDDCSRFLLGFMSIRIEVGQPTNASVLA